MASNKFNKTRPKYTPPKRCHTVPPGPPRWPGDYDVPKTPSILANLILPIGTTTAPRQVTAQCWLYPSEPTRHNWFGIARAPDGSDFQISVDFHSPTPGASMTIVRLTPGMPFVAGTHELDNVANQATFMLQWTPFATSNSTDVGGWPRVQLLS